MQIVIYNEKNKTQNYGVCITLKVSTWQGLLVLLFQLFDPLLNTNTD